MNALALSSFLSVGLLPSADCFAQRWAWPWRDPNHLAAVAAMLQIAVTVLLIWLLSWPPVSARQPTASARLPTATAWRCARIVAVALTMSLALMLVLSVAASASRAGLLALVVGLTVVAWAQSGWRWRCWR